MTKHKQIQVKFWLKLEKQLLDQLSLQLEDQLREELEGLKRMYSHVYLQLWYQLKKL